MPSARANPPLTSALSEPSAIPYFLWDQPMTAAELRERLATGTDDERAYWLGKILREARDTDVWHFTTPEQVIQLWPRITIHLGRRRPFWEFLFDLWRREGLIVNGVRVDPTA